MNRLQPVEIMLRGIKEVQLFLLANPYKDYALIEPNLISYDLVKLTKKVECVQRAFKNGTNALHSSGENWLNYQHT